MSNRIILNLQGEKSALDAQVATLRGENATLSNENAKYRQKNEKLQTKIKTLEAQVDEKTKFIHVTKASMNDISTSLKVVQQNHNRHQNELNDAEGLVDTLQQDLAAVAGADQVQNSAKTTAQQSRICLNNFTDPIATLCGHLFVCECAHVCLCL